jgi:hypothetical protein
MPEGDTVRYFRRDEVKKGDVQTVTPIGEAEAAKLNSADVIRMVYKHFRVTVAGWKAAEIGLQADGSTTESRDQDAREGREESEPPF